MQSGQRDLNISLISIYNDWIKAKKDKTWAARNYLNLRALSHALLVRSQLASLVQVRYK